LETLSPHSRTSLSRTDAARIGGIAAFTLAISALHYFTPDSLVQWHYLIQRLFYLPVVYAALSYGLAGGLLGAVAAGLSLLPQIIATWRVRPEYSINQFAELFSFAAVAILTGTLSDRERRQKASLSLAAGQVRQMYAELQENFERMKRTERLYALGQLSAGLAHEVRNPLASIEGAAAILLREPPSEERRVEFLEIIQKESRRLNRLLSTFLDFAKPRAPEFQMAKVERVIDSVLALTEHSFLRAAIAVRREVATDLPPFEHDPEQITQILLNLTINAIQAMPNGGEIAISAFREGDSAVIEVSDQGCGISEEDMERIYDPFFTTKETGTGLGLPVAHQIALNQGGILAARRNTGNGMTFSLRLPLRAGAAE